MPKGQMCPADVIGDAARIAKIATSEIEEMDYKQPTKVKSGRAEAKGRAELMTAGERGAAAKKTAAGR